jgi:hypothetical protein
MKGRRLALPDCELKELAGLDPTNAHRQVISGASKAQFLQRSYSLYGATCRS